MSNGYKALISVLVVAVGGMIQAVAFTKSTAQEGVPYLFVGIMIWLLLGIIIAIDYNSTKR